MGINCNLLSVLCTLAFPLLLFHLQIWGKGTYGCPVMVDAPKHKMAGDCASYKAYWIPQTWILSDVLGKPCMCKAECKPKRIPNQYKYWCKNVCWDSKITNNLVERKINEWECHWFLKANDIPGIAKTKTGTGSWNTSKLKYGGGGGALFHSPHSNSPHLSKKIEPEVGLEIKHLATFPTKKDLYRKSCVFKMQDMFFFKTAPQSCWS